MSTSLQIEREGRILRLTLNRPAKRNALSAELCRSLLQALAEADADAGVGAVLLQAAGQVFCAGMDLDEVVGGDADELTALHEELFTVGVRMSKPLVAAVQGPALGGGLGLLANAPIAVAAQGATFGLTEIRMGLWPFVVFRAMEAALGARRTLDLALTGRIFGTQEAVQWGLVQQVVPAFELDDRAADLAAHLAASSAQAIRAGMSFVRESRGLDAAAAAALAARCRREAFASADLAEGVRAFQEKRKPKWPSIHGV